MFSIAAAECVRVEFDQRFFFAVPLAAVRAKGNRVNSTIKPFTQQHHQLYACDSSSSSSKFQLAASFIVCNALQECRCDWQHRKERADGGLWCARFALHFMLCV
jgi:hypothetical protein